MRPMSSSAPPLPGGLGSGHPSEPVVAHILGQPGVQRTPSAKLPLFQKRGFLDADLCAAVMALIDVRRRPSTVSAYTGDAAFRTSATCDLDATDPVVAHVEARIL